MASIKLEFTVLGQFVLEPKAAQHILAVYHGVRNGHIQDGPEGFLNASQKLYDDASNDLILHTVIGEVVSCIFKNEVPEYFPPVSLGFHASPLRVAYQEVPEKLSPPANAHPLLITHGNSTKH